MLHNALRDVLCHPNAGHSRDRCLFCLLDISYRDDFTCMVAETSSEGPFRSPAQSVNGDGLVHLWNNGSGFQVPRTQATFDGIVFTPPEAYSS